MKSKALIIGLLATLAACSDNHYHQPVQVVAQQPQYVEAPAPVVIQQPAPVIVQQVHSHDHLMTGALLGGAVGYMAGRSHSQPTYVDRRPVIVQHTTVVHNYHAPAQVTVVRAAPRSYAPSPSRLSLSKPSSSFGGFSRRR